MPPPGFVHLILVERPTGSLYLEIPINIILLLCLFPRKYLRFLGWCILGVVGDLVDEQGEELDLDGNLVDQGVYKYRAPDAITLAQAVDLEVIKQRTNVPSETTNSREDFRRKLIERDGPFCVWTGIDRATIGMHIIPFRRGTVWLRLIIANREPNASSALTSIEINDIRNGILALSAIHSPSFDAREVVVLKTPNPVLGTTDVPPQAVRLVPIEAGLHHPQNSRYTFQWLVEPRMAAMAVFPNNNDATFMDRHLPKPADVLLHYNYGAAAMKQWGKNTEILTKRPGIPRPPQPAVVPMGPEKIIHDRSVAIDNRQRNSTDAGAQGSSRNARSEQVDAAAGESDPQTAWDEDDVMLFLWGNSKPSQERHAQKEKERSDYMEKWRAGIAV
ncbi:hypothetical protein C8J56DRAFT_1024135 [Mycena floridula]|nr:hypothetical protein C8J56DRAFT_1024135 [Mycena floridula]